MTPIIPSRPALALAAQVVAAAVTCTATEDRAAVTRLLAAQIDLALQRQRRGEAITPESLAAALAGAGLDLGATFREPHQGSGRAHLALAVADALTSLARAPLRGGVVSPQLEALVAVAASYGVPPAVVAPHGTRLLAALQRTALTTSLPAALFAPVTPVG